MMCLSTLLIVHSKPGATLKKSSYKSYEEQGVRSAKNPWNDQVFIWTWYGLYQSDI